MTKITENLNQDLHKEQAIYYRSAVKQMIRSFIKKCPKDVLKEVLQSEKIISRDWLKNGTKYKLYEKQ